MRSMVLVIFFVMTAVAIPSDGRTIPSMAIDELLQGKLSPMTANLEVVALESSADAIVVFHTPARDWGDVPPGAEHVERAWSTMSAVRCQRRCLDRAGRLLGLLSAAHLVKPPVDIPVDYGTVIAFQGQGGEAIGKVYVDSGGRIIQINGHQFLAPSSIVSFIEQQSPVNW